MNFLKITDLEKKEIEKILKSSSTLKKEKLSKKTHYRLENQNIGLFFETPSTRTRISFSAGINDLGANSIFMDQTQLQLARGESLKDTGEVLSRYLDSIAIRSLSHKKVQELSENSNIPIINAMTKKYHPCQALADLMTIKEYKGSFEDLKFAWVGDGNNVCHSNILANSLMGVETAIATPRGYEPDDDVINEARNIKGNIKIYNNPKKATKGADIIYTDVWFSTGQEKSERKEKDFDGFTVDQALIEEAENDVIIMHCMPIKGKEIRREIVNGPHSVIYEQAENRLHTEKALMLELLER